MEEESEKPKEYLVNIKRVGGLLASNWGWILTSVVLMVLKRYYMLQENVLGGEIVDSFQKGKWDDFVNVTWRLTFSYMIVGALQVAESFFSSRIKAIVGRSLKTRLIKSLIIQKPQSFFDQHKSGDIASRITHDCDSIASDLGSWIPILVTEIFEVVFGAYFMLNLNLGLCGIIALVLPISAVASLLENHWNYPLQEASTKTVGEVNSDIIEAITQVKTIRSFNQQSHHLTNFAKHLQALDRINFRLSIASGISHSLSNMGYSMCMCASFWYGGSLVLSGDLSTGQFLAFSLFATGLSGAISYIPDLNTQFISILVSAERVYSVIERNDTSLYKEDDSEDENAEDGIEENVEQLLNNEHSGDASSIQSEEHSILNSGDRLQQQHENPTSKKAKSISKPVSTPPLAATPQHNSSSTSKSCDNSDLGTMAVSDSSDPRSNADPSVGFVPPPSHRVLGHIKFNNVCFSYQSRPDSKVLNGFDLEILPGQCAALVGASGGGKSTIVSLLSKFYEVDSGSITLDGLELAKLQPKWLRNQIGLVSQEPVLFSNSIRYNICYGVSDTSEEGGLPVVVSQARLEEVSKMANAHDFISSLPNGYDTMIGERGCMLSSGQRQRIAIARAMLRDPKILITDEATSALDNASERVVQQALERLMLGRTCIVVAHRLTTIRKCFPICVLGKGHILEQGSHDDLMAMENGHYHHLHSYEREKEHLLQVSQEIHDLASSQEMTLRRMTSSQEMASPSLTQESLPHDEFSLNDGSAPNMTPKDSLNSQSTQDPTDDAHSPRQRVSRK